MNNTKPPPKEFDPQNEDLENLVTEAVNNVFRSMFGMEAKFLKSSTLITKIGTSSLGPEREISGIMSFVQADRIEGSFSFGLSRKGSLQLMSGFYGEEMPGLDDPRVLSGMAELANMIHGQLKHRLNEKGYEFHMTLPFVVIGNNHNLFSASVGRSFLYEYDISGHNALVEIFVQTKK